MVYRSFELDPRAAVGVTTPTVELLAGTYGMSVEQTSVFDHSSLTRLAVDVGLDGADVSRVLASDEYDDAVATDEATAHQLGATGVPFFVIDRRYGISGAQPASAIARALDQAWADSSVRSIPSRRSAGQSPYIPAKSRKVRTSSAGFLAGDPAILFLTIGDLSSLHPREVMRADSRWWPGCVRGVRSAEAGELDRDTEAV